MTFRDNDASLRDELNGYVPRLRRYARALTRGSSAPSELADDLVHATLMRALGARHLGVQPDLLIRVYATLTQLHRDLAVSGRQARVAGARSPVLVGSGPHTSAERQTKLSAGLMALPLEAREALLLVGLEGFDYVQTARILRISRGVLMARLTEARAALDSSLGKPKPIAPLPLSPLPVSPPVAPMPVASVQKSLTRAFLVGSASSDTVRTHAPHLRLVSSRS